MHDALLLRSSVARLLRILEQNNPVRAGRMPPRSAGRPAAGGQP